MIYGMQETSEDIGDDGGTVVRDVYIEGLGLDMPNTVDAYRVGKRENGKTRPVRAEFPYPGDVKFVLTIAHKLKAKLPTVYLGPDRSKEERQAHNKLVTQMKTLIKQDSSKHYYIRDNKICHVDKKLSPG